MLRVALSIAEYVQQLAICHHQRRRSIRLSEIEEVVASRRLRGATLLPTTARCRSYGNSMLTPLLAPSFLEGARLFPRPRDRKLVHEAQFVRSCRAVERLRVLARASPTLR